MSNKPQAKNIQIVLTLFFAMVVLFILGIEMIRQTQATVLRGLEERANQAVLATVQGLRSVIIHRSVYIENLSLSLGFPIYNHDQIQRDLYKANRDPFVASIYVGFEEDGRFIATYRDQKGLIKEWQPSDDFEPRQRKWYQLAKASPETIYSPAYIDAISGDYIVSIAKALRNSDDSLIGVVGLDITLNQLTNYVKSISIGRYGSIFIIDSEGTILTHPDSTQVAKNIKDQQGSARRIGEVMLKGEKGWSLLKDGKESFYVYYQPVDVIGWSVGVFIPQAEVTGSSITVITKISVTGMLILVITILLLLYISVKSN